MPIGRVKWYNADRGYGFVTNPEGDDCYVGKQVLPEGVTELHPGQRIEFDYSSGRRGPQALRVAILHAPKAHRLPHKPHHNHKPEELHSMISDVMTLLEGIQPGLLHGRYPDTKHGKQVAGILRAIAKELDS